MSAIVGDWDRMEGAALEVAEAVITHGVPSDFAIWRGGHRSGFGAWRGWELHCEGVIEMYAEGVREGAIDGGRAGDNDDQ